MEITASVMFCFNTRRVFSASAKTSGSCEMPSASACRRSTSAAAAAASDGVDATATPTSAAAKAGASLIPSPTMATPLPFASALRRSMNAALSSGRSPPTATASAPVNPSSNATASTAGCRSPESTTTRMPMSWSRRTDAAAPGLTRSASASAPITPSPSTPTHTKLHAAAAGPPSASEFSAAAAPSAAAVPPSAPTSVSTHEGSPTNTRLPSTIAEAPRPGTVSAFFARGVFSPAAAAAAATAAATGADVGEELIHGLGGEELAEEHGPVGLDFDTRRLDDGVHLVSGHLLTIVGEDERGVGAREIAGHLRVFRDAVLGFEDGQRRAFTGDTARDERRGDGKGGHGREWARRDPNERASRPDLERVERRARGAVRRTRGFAMALHRRERKPRRKTGYAEDARREADGGRARTFKVRRGVRHASCRRCCFNPSGASGASS
mmetsp:Transcript_8497/g.35499  ORF Transcript_8497/g.35499 Transcript_8497/m.35499 type:complete len:440 (+) Transcript_8497:1252-2571(+)